MNTLHIGDFRRRLPKSGAPRARPVLSEASRLCNRVSGVRHAVVRLLGALDRKMTANLDRRARYLLHGDDGPDSR
jgi:hypothetical protein